MAVDRYISTLSNYVHPQESNLLNIHKAMEYNDAVASVTWQEHQ